MRHTISVLVENEFGVLTRVAGLFSGRGYNIQSLTVGETLDPKISRMTIVTSGSDAVLEQIGKQLSKLVNVIRVQDVSREAPINRILALVKVAMGADKRGEVLKSVKKLGGEILDRDAQCCIAEFRVDEEKLKHILSELKTFGILEFVQTGNIAMQRGRKVIA